MPEIAFMFVDGIDGESNVQNQDKAIEVLTFDHEVVKEVDPLDCSKVKSDRRHGVANVTKYFDKATPLLHMKLCEGGSIKKIEIKWFRQPEGGGSDPEHYFTHTFLDCIVTSLKPHMDNALDPTKKEFGHMELMSWGYKQLTWKSVTGGTEFADKIRQ
ncbi:MAG: type VI secretion system tube protein Hcp [bacterium]|nr:type VI secretion system tube protein Hcp [bacterium]